MKKLFSILYTLMLVSGILVGCGSSSSSDSTVIEKQIELAKKRDVYADMIIKNGIRVKKGDQVAIVAYMRSKELVDELSKKAYAAGADKVEVTFYDAPIDTPKNSSSPEAADTVKADMVLNNQARKFIEVYSPALNNSPSTPKFYEEFTGLKNFAAQNRNIFCIVIYPNMSWAKKVYPNMAEQDALIKLTEDIYKFTLTTTESSGFPNTATTLEARAKALTEMEITALHYKSDVMDLKVPLHKNNQFIGGVMTANGVSFFPNIPTLEVFAAPTKFGASGTVKNTVPLVLKGNIVDGISMTFAGGKLVDYRVEKGKEYFDTLLATMPEGVYLGEIAIVNTDSPIAQSGTVYYNTLLDENAGCHLALGAALSFNLKDGVVPDEDFNQATTHTDIVIGNDKTNITATLKDGRTVELLKDGKWVKF